MTILIVIVLACFSSLAYGQEPTFDQVLTKIKMSGDSTAKRKIDQWIAANFQEWNGKRYFGVRRTKDESFQEASERAKRIGMSVAERLSTTFPDSVLIFAELENMTWKISKDTKEISELEKKNDEVEDDWRGTISLISNGKPAYSRSFVQCGWSKYQNGFYDAFSNPVGIITVYERKGEWHFETGDYSYVPVTISEIKRVQDFPKLSDEQMKRLPLTLLGGKCPSRDQ